MQENANNDYNYFETSESCFVLSTKHPHFNEDKTVAFSTKQAKALAAVVPLTLVPLKLKVNA